MANQSQLFRRYVLLYGLFGLLLGLRYGADVWVLQILSPRPEDKHLYMALVMGGMLLGEYLGGRLTDRCAPPAGRRGRSAPTAAVLTGAGVYAASTIAYLIAVGSGQPAPLYFGAAAFGLGFGIQHSSLDSWFSKAVELAAPPASKNPRPTDGQMAWGYTAYTAAFFAGQALSFPLLYDFRWDLAIASQVGRDWVPLRVPVSPTPYLLALLLSGAVYLLPPMRVGAGERPDEDGKREGEAGDVPWGYRGVIRAGGVPFAMIVLVGGGVSFLIQHIDSFGATDLLARADTVWAKTRSLSILHLAAAVWVGLFAWTLDQSKRYETLSPRERVGFLSVNLTAILALLGGALLVTAGDNTVIVTAVLVGSGHALLNTLPQVIKWAVLDYAGLADRGTASAILGYTKRVPNLLLSLLLLGGVDRPSDEVMYGVLVMVTAASLLALIVYSFYIRRSRLLVVLPAGMEPGKAEAFASQLQGLIEHRVNQQRNMTVRFSNRLDPPAGGRPQFRVRLYSIRDDRQFVDRLAADIAAQVGDGGSCRKE